MECWIPPIASPLGQFSAAINNDSEELAPTRTELSALLRLLNEALMTRIATVNATAGAVRDALQAQPSLKPA
ncbi:hypothetical protein [Variovorax sp. 38R]|uniref:hypothetical protein n=1 Tax=Variovorax sp. 38R TaxID=2774875 RepID=UPI00177C6240|nr:hypothetical protein [Variovorax sp. 38R]QOF79357.1 hypothetical protein IG196_02840 [Variovorax sp. 38R]